MTIKKIFAALTVLIAGANAHAAQIASTDYVIRAVEPKANLEADGTAGEVATVDATGQYVRSGISASDVATTINNVVTLGDEVDDLTTNITNLGTDVDGKADLQAPGAAGTIATVDANGQYVRGTVTEAEIADVIENALTSSDVAGAGVEMTANRVDAIDAGTSGTAYPSVAAVREYTLPNPPAACATTQCVLSVDQGSGEPYWETVTFPAP